MAFPRPASGIVLASLALAFGLSTASSAKAEDLVDFLWGGSAEYGGGRSVVSFDPQYKPNQIIVSFSDRRLYLITKPGEAITYPVAIPTGEARWQGVTFVSSKRVNPPWTPTPDMVRQNPRLPRWVPGGHPMNPLGIRAMYLGSSAYRIHGTDAPWTIGQAVSHGCIRMTNEDVLDLYPRVPVGMRVTVTWQQFSTHSVSANYPRYGEDASAPRNSGSSSNSGSGSGYTYGSYSGGTSGDASARTASNKSNEGSISSLFFWDDAPPAPKPMPSASEVTSGEPDDDVSALTPAAPTAKKKSAAATPTSVKKKSSAAVVTPQDPAARPSALAPDPAKPASAPAESKSSMEKESETMPAATKASASAEEAMPVQAASQVQ